MPPPALALLLGRLYRQPSDAALGRRENGIGDRGGHSGCSRFAQAARINRARHYMCLDWWRFIDAQRRIRVKVALFDSAVLDRYRAAQRSRESEDRSALYLCVDHLRIDRQATIHRADDTFHPHISFLVDGRLRHLRR